ncbi:MAG: hypothetical protein CL539_06335 [Alcanivorax sp.]|uniref:hypothetical protein n=1 Tax=unclassified Alcanivorax TaxID=2638842 RepID=UPI000C98A256|nr:MULTISPECIES: hypothetical protein [unclassified Alcanivorax]MAC14284.1 hypothetical protein [Alcanivorax sp.]|tara:strand:- start:1054 stop:2274 length:1221 start_codon:yes stop_codon:yes gene_type:complete
MALKTVPFNVAFDFSRPDPADYEDVNGDTQTAGTDVPRFNYSEGVGEGLLLDASLSETAAINDIPAFNASEGTWVIKADLDKSMLIPGSGFGEFMEGSGTLVFVYTSGSGKCWSDGQVLFTVDSFSAAEPGFLSSGGLAKIKEATYYPFAFSDSRSAENAIGSFSLYFGPELLFSDGEQGAWYDPSDLTTLFQDAAGTTPVTADGDPVGLILDKSGNDNHASQATTAAKPTYRTDGTLHWLELDGIDDYLSLPPILLGAASDSNSAISASLNTGGGFYLMGGSADEGFNVLPGETGFRVSVHTSPLGLVGFATGLFDSGTKIVASSVFDRSEETVDLSLSTGYVASNSAVGDKSIPVALALGIRGLQQVNQFQGNFYGLVINNAVISERQRQEAESFFSVKAGVTL